MQISPAPFLSFVFVFVVLLAPKATGATEPEKPSEEEVTFFEQKIRPLLIERCYQCHSSAKKVKGGLRLDARKGWEQGGESGPAIAQGKPDESLLVKAVRYHDTDLKMPPAGKLADREIELF